MKKLPHIITLASNNINISRGSEKKVVLEIFLTVSSQWAKPDLFVQTKTWGPKAPRISNICFSVASFSLPENLLSPILDKQKQTKFHSAGISSDVCYFFWSVFCLCTGDIFLNSIVYISRKDILPWVTVLPLHVFFWNWVRNSVRTFSIPYISFPPPPYPSI